MSITAKDGTYAPELDNRLAVRPLLPRSHALPARHALFDVRCAVAHATKLPALPLQIDAQCDVTGSGAVNSASCWEAQLTLCGAKECNTALLPPFGAAGSVVYDPGKQCSALAASKSAPVLCMVQRVGSLLQPDRSAAGVRARRKERQLAVFSSCQLLGLLGSLCKCLMGEHPPSILHSCRSFLLV